MNSPPRLRSLRWQLPFSYAAIALLAVLALGITLLGTLRGFYQEQERSYLAGNAVAIAEEIAPLLAAGDLATLQAEIAAYSFLMQARVQVLDVAGQTVVADSGELSSFTPALSVDVGEPGLLEALGGVETDVAVVIEEQQQIEDGVISTERIVTRTSLLPAQGSLYGFNLGVEPTAVTERSNLIEETRVVDDTGRLIGRLRLSQGPAYGGDIVRSVAWGWSAAGLVAVFLAALIGWLVSRRLTQPLLALTAVTGRMAEGDLSVRANVRRANELGILGQAFNRMAAQVENTVQSLRQFTADAAHELHTPLTALQTDLQLLESDVDAAQKPRLARAQAQALRLQDLADSLLELSRLEAAVNGVQSSFNLTRLVQAAGELAASQAEQMDLTLALQLPEQPVMVRGDESQLQRALLNVLDNSLKFTPPPGEIVLALAVAGETAVITVRDSGIGIPPEDGPQLFSRFHRGRNTADYPGSGLGLAIVQEIMARHNGRVAIESGETGTKVRLILPGES
jgi:signal transduction histidine kinase